MYFSLIVSVCSWASAPGMSKREGKEKTKQNTPKPKPKPILPHGTCSQVHKDVLSRSHCERAVKSYASGLLVLRSVSRVCTNHWQQQASALPGLTVGKKAALLSCNRICVRARRLQISDSYGFGCVVFCILVSSIRHFTAQ